MIKCKDCGYDIMTVQPNGVTIDDCKVVSVMTAPRGGFVIKVECNGCHTLQAIKMEPDAPPQMRKGFNLEPRKKS